MASLVGAIFDEASTLSEAERNKALGAIGSTLVFDNISHLDSGSFKGTDDNDVFHVDGAAQILEKPDGGTDLVVSSVSHHLDNNVEHLILTGSDDIDGKGNNEDNVIAGNSGDNELDGAAGDDMLIGSEGNDDLEGGSGDDTLCGGDDNDTLEGGSGEDKLDGGSGDDVLAGGSNDDHLDGGEGNDDLEGGSGDDNLQGGAGNDQLNGGSGDDTLEGGEGNDTLDGDAGDNTFVFGNNSGADVVKDFNEKRDILEITLNVNGTGITSGQDIVDSHLSTDGSGNTVVDLGGGNNITLLGVSEDDVDAGFFKIV